MALGNLFIISAPSGAGKTSLVKAVVDKLAHVSVSVSYATRGIREGEVDGEDYCFISVAEFEEKIKAGEFVEYAKVFDNYYGTSRLVMEQQLLTGNDVILEIDWQGGQQVRRQIIGCISIFILPPSRQELEQRLRGRGTDDEAVIQRRMQDVVTEISHYNEADFLVINVDFDVAAAELMSIIQAQRLTLDYQQARHQQLLNKILE
ncbi:MAG: guanylate kinase [Gammaproteobacteria bacterium]|nr:guanylate kinase [Gammaproteobacteria bacterium]